MRTTRQSAAIGQQVGAFGAYRDGMEVYGRSTASTDRQLVSLEDWSHYDLYDKPEPVRLAMEKIGPFFKQHVGQAAVVREVEPAK